MTTSTKISATTKPGQRWFAVGLSCFWVATIFGCLMRFSWIEELPGLSYKHLLHAHSHLALLGWAFMIVSGGFLFLLLPGSLRNSSMYRWVFGLNTVAAIGMGFGFVYQGYGAISIGFCTVHLVAAYLFGYQYLKDLKTTEDTSYRRLARWAIYWLFVSTLGLWAIGPIKSILGQLHPLYFASIQFFLHFQFNGWLTYGMLALLLHWLSREGKPVTLPSYLFWGLQASLLLTYALSVSWSTPLSVVFYLNSAGVVIQLAVFVLIWQLAAPVIRTKSKRSRQVAILLWVGLASLAAKIIVQSAVAIPAVAKISYTIHNFVIGFIHLTMIGSISLVVIALLLEARLFPDSKTANVGYVFFLLGFISTEFLLFGQGCLLWMGWGYLPNYYELIFGCSLLFPLATTMMLTAFWRTRQTTVVPI
ncbi:hypothetical protein [Neolewinella persica]|uniref:hypothetical protein n=1 Tax=Neolewinella persica TaxID=70998 RepID=UPI00039F4912|nr:hypothetical protein [Neolewinella persica]